MYLMEMIFISLSRKEFNKKQQDLGDNKSHQSCSSVWSTHTLGLGRVLNQNQLIYQYFEINLERN